jgi:hypothetical protein
MIFREQVLRFLQKRQETERGYTGNDLTNLAELLHVTPQGLRKRLSTWIKKESLLVHVQYFPMLIYLPFPDT